MSTYSLIENDNNNNNNNNKNDDIEITVNIFRFKFTDDFQKFTNMMTEKTSKLLGRNG